MQRIAALWIVLLSVACGGSTTSGVEPSSDGYRLVKNADGSATGDGSTCTYAGRTAAVDEAFAAPDGCNDCKCTSTGAMCTQRSCSSSSSSTSSSGSSDACRPGATRTIPNAECPAASASCTCQQDGTELCVAPTIACVPKPPPPADRCPKGEVYSDGCNQCNCDPATGVVGCSKKACICPASGTTINCMPAVPPERAEQCSGPYHEWLTKNCPDVKFVY